MRLYNAQTLPLPQIVAVASFGYAHARFSRYWGDEVLLNGGGAKGIHSIALEKKDINGSRFINLPLAEYIIVDLVTPPRCLTCSGMVMEFERAARGLQNLCKPTRKPHLPELPIPLLCAVSVDCLEFGALCHHFGVGHTEPFHSTVIDEPAVAPEPPRGWLRAWATSSLVLARRDHLLADMWVPVYWRLDSYDAAPQIIDWIRTRLGNLPPHGKISDDALAQLWTVSLPPRKGDWEMDAMKSLGYVGHLTDHGALCKQAWTTCSGGFFGHFQNCQSVSGCDQTTKTCRLEQKLRDRDWDTCSPEEKKTNSIPHPVLKANSIDSELAASLWLHTIWEDAEFSVLYKVGKDLAPRGIAKRRILLDFLRILCESFPHDSRESSEESENLMSGAASLIANRAKIVASLSGDIHHKGRRLGEEHVLQCRKSFCRLHSLLRRKWNILTKRVPGKRAVRVSASRLEKMWHFCSHSWGVWSTKKWHECRGSFAGTRQLPCGIWTLLHSVLGHAEEAAGQAIFTTAAELINAKAERRPPGWVAALPGHIIATIRTFIKEFMACNACKVNFLAVPYDADSIVTHRDATLWLWRAHNYVNGVVQRLAYEEKAFAEDPAFPSRHYWPPEHLCPECRRNPVRLSQEAAHEAALMLVRSKKSELYVAPFDKGACGQGDCPIEAEEWNLDRVFIFLSEFYGDGVVDGPVWSLLSANVTGGNTVLMIDGNVRRIGHSRMKATWDVVLWAAVLVVGTLVGIHCLKWPRGRRTMREYCVSPVIFRGVRGERVTTNDPDDVFETARLMEDEVVSSVSSNG